MDKIIQMLGTFLIIFITSDLSHQKMPKFILLIVILMRVGFAVTFGIGTISLWWSWHSNFWEKLYASLILGGLAIFYGYRTVSSVKQIKGG